MSDQSQNNRIAKNTAYLYFRTIFILLVSLYTSRIVLKNLGVEDYGIYNVIGGVVGMFSIISGTLSAAISRFITFELGRKNVERLKEIFTVSLIMQICISLIVIFLGETVGLWFVTEKLNIPVERIPAAEWVWHSAIAIFIFSFLRAPYNATIIAHEHMNAFALISVMEAILKLVVVFMLSISSYDKLVTYSLLLVVVSFGVLISHFLYCKLKFSECVITRITDKSISKKIVEFASWTFFNHGASVLNHQGVNILMNLFFGVTSNAARGVTNQVEHAIMQFVNNFTMAVNPQITKSYAIGDKRRMFNLICMGSKYSYYLMLVFALPIFIETDYILSVWLTVVPDDTSCFIKLALIGAMIQMLGNTGYTACMATGTIRRYSLWITLVGSMTFPLAWLMFKMGMPPYAAYLSFIIVNIFVNITRLFLMRTMLGFPIMLFVHKVVANIILITGIACIIPLLLQNVISSNIYRFLLEIIVCTMSSICTCFYIGMSKNERNYFLELFRYKIIRKRK